MICEMRREIKKSHGLMLEIKNPSHHLFAVSPKRKSVLTVMLPKFPVCLQNVQMFHVREISEILSRRI